MLIRIFLTLNYTKNCFKSHKIECEECVRNGKIKRRIRNIKKSNSHIHTKIEDKVKFIYTSNKVDKYLKELDLVHSYSKKGYPYDNAGMESFNAILKKEEVNLYRYTTVEEARRAIFEFIESWYNRRRIHSSIEYKVPNELENEVA